MFLYRPRRQFSISFLASHAATFSLFFYLYIVFVFRGLCSLEEPLKTRVCFRYPAVDFPANNRVTTVTPNETVLNEIFLIITLTHWIHLVGRNRTFFLLVFYYPMEKIGALHFITYILSLSETPSFSIHDHHTSLIRLYNLRFQRAVRNTFVRLVRRNKVSKKRFDVAFEKGIFFEKCDTIDREFFEITHNLLFNEKI